MNEKRQQHSRLSYVDEIYYVNEISDHESSDYDILDEFSPNQE